MSNTAADDEQGASQDGSDARERSGGGNGGGGGGLGTASVLMSTSTVSTTGAAASANSAKAESSSGGGEQASSDAGTSEGESTGGASQGSDASTAGAGGGMAAAQAPGTRQAGAAGGGAGHGAAGSASGTGIGPRDAASGGRDAKADTKGEAAGGGSQSGGGSDAAASSSSSSASDGGSASGTSSDATASSEGGEAADAAGGSGDGSSASGGDTGSDAATDAANAATEAAAQPDSSGSAAGIGSSPSIGGITPVASPVCFRPGTLIATPTGPVAIEALRPGDLVLTAEGAVEPVLWIGRQTVDGAAGDPLRVLPIRIRAGALAPNVPSRDLYVSPDHAIAVDGVLVHAGALVDGDLVQRQTDAPRELLYLHVELSRHCLILAEDLPAETFVDNPERLAFENFAEREALLAGKPPVREMDLPRAKSARQVPGSVRRRLAMRALALSQAERILAA